MKLIRLSRDMDFDIEEEIDWKYDSYRTMINKIKRKTTVQKITGDTQ